uniref:Ribonuclease Z n=1 Tax=Flintiella sanguinaria TaxID=101926 RepID=A0A1X9PW84_9RHOD|nr:ribonuclease Z [Flintiella sanguinaria]
MKNYSSKIFKLGNLPDIWLFDCGEGTQSLSKNRIKSNRVSKIFISNFNTSNITGLIGLLATFNLGGRTKLISIYGPDNFRRYLFNILKYSQTNFSFKIKIIDINKNIIYHNQILRLYILPTYNFNKVFAYKIIEKQKSGKFQTEKAKLYDLRPSFIYKQLKNGEVFILFDGTTINGRGEDFCYNPLVGTKTVITSKELNCRITAEFMWDTDYCAMEFIDIYHMHLYNQYIFINNQIIKKLLIKYYYEGKFLLIYSDYNI